VAKLRALAAWIIVLAAGVLSTELAMRAAAKDEVYIQTQTSSNSNCPGGTDIWLKSRSSRVIVAHVKRTNTVDNQVSVTDYTINAGDQLHIGCQQYGAGTNTYIITGAEYK
jgi:FlaG/FlaF family flagellin (archaellin)